MSGRHPGEGAGAPRASVGFCRVLWPVKVGTLCAGVGGICSVEKPASQSSMWSLNTSNGSGGGEFGHQCELLDKDTVAEFGVTRR